MATDGRIMSWRLVSRVLGERRVARWPGTSRGPRRTRPPGSGATTKGGRASRPKVAGGGRRCRGAGSGLRDVTRASGMATAKARTWQMMMSSRSMPGTGGQDVGHRLVVRYEAPRLPWKTAFEPDQYWCHSGLLSPSCFSRMARLAAVSLGPRMTTVGSPGSRWTSRKTSTEMMKDDHDQLEEPPEEVLAHRGRAAAASARPLARTARSGVGKKMPSSNAYAGCAVGQGGVGEVLDPARGHLGEDVLLQPQVREVLGQPLVDRLVGLRPGWPGSVVCRPVSMVCSMSGSELRAKLRAMLPTGRPWWCSTTRS